MLIRFEARRGTTPTCLELLTLISNTPLLCFFAVEYAFNQSVEESLLKALREHTLFTHVYTCLDYCVAVQGSLEVGKQSVHFLS